MQQQLNLSPLQTLAPPIRPQLHVQPNPNMNNKVSQSIDATVSFQTYLITHIGFNEVQLRSGKVIIPDHTPLITEEEYESPRKDIVNSEIFVTLVKFDKTPIVTPVAASSGKPIVSTSSNPSRASAHVIANSDVRAHDTPYPQRLIEIGPASEIEYDFLKESHNLYVHIPLLLALKEVPIYAKIVRDLCVKNPRRKPKDPDIIHFMGKLFELMIDQPFLTKYNDPGNPTVTVHIDDQPITNTMIDLGEAINVMTKDPFISLGIHGLKPTPTFLELADRSHFKLEGVIEYVVITIASWNYPADFLI